MLDFKGPIPRMTFSRGLEAIKELAGYLFVWHNEEGMKGELEPRIKEINVIFEQIADFKQNMKFVTKEDRMSSGTLPSASETNPRGLAHIITTRSGLNYKPPLNPLDDTETSNDVHKMSSNKNKKEEVEVKKNVEELGEQKGWVNLMFHLFHFQEVALEEMPKYAKFMKDILTNKAKFKETSKVTFNERCSAVLLNEIPLKERD
ncbi:hypothetical protein Tco_0570105 [Tanacetum coccineum]